MSEEIDFWKLEHKARIRAEYVIGELREEIKQLERALAHARADLEAGTGAWARDRQRVTELEANITMLQTALGMTSAQVPDIMQRAARTAVRAERERCLRAVDRVADGYVVPVYWAEKVRREIEADARQ